MTDERTDLRPIIVISFSPSLYGPNAVGGFDWVPGDDREALTNAKALMKTYVDQNNVDGQDANYNLTWTYLHVPRDLDGDALTKFIDARLEAVELPGTIETEN